MRQIDLLTSVWRVQKAVNRIPFKIREVIVDLLSEQSPPTKLVAIAGALVFVLLLLVSWHWVYGDLWESRELLFSVHVGPWLWWATIGCALVGAVLLIALVRDGLVTPLLGVMSIYTIAVFQTWHAVRAPEPALPGTPLDLVLVGWPLLLGLALAVGIIEQRVRATTKPPQNSDVT